MAFQQFLKCRPWKMLAVQCTAEHFKSANNILPFPLVFFKVRGWGSSPEYISVLYWKKGTFPKSWLICLLLCPGVFFWEEVSGAELEVGLWCHLSRAQGWNVRTPGFSQDTELHLHFIHFRHSYSYLRGPLYFNIGYMKSIWKYS